MTFVFVSAGLPNLVPWSYQLSGQWFRIKGDISSKQPLAWPSYDVPKSSNNSNNNNSNNNNTASNSWPLNLWQQHQSLLSSFHFQGNSRWRGAVTFGRRDILSQSAFFWHERVASLQTTFCRYLAIHKQVNHWWQLIEYRLIIFVYSMNTKLETNFLKIIPSLTTWQPNRFCKRLFTPWWAIPGLVGCSSRVV